MSPSLLLIATLPLPPIFVAFACRHVQGATSMSLSLRRCSLHQRRHRLPRSLLLTPFRRTSFKPYILVPSLNMLQHVRRIALSFCFKSGAVWRSNSFVRHKTAAALSRSGAPLHSFPALSALLGSRVVTSSNRCSCERFGLRVCLQQRLVCNQLPGSLWRIQLRNYVSCVEIYFQGTSRAIVYLCRPFVPTVHCGLVGFAYFSLFFLSWHCTARVRHYFVGSNSLLGPGPGL